MENKLDLMYKQPMMLNKEEALNKCFWAKMI